MINCDRWEQIKKTQPLFAKDVVSYANKALDHLLKNKDDDFTFKRFYDRLLGTRIINNVSISTTLVEDLTVLAHTKIREA